MFDGTYLRNNRKQNVQRTNPGGMPTEQNQQIFRHLDGGWRPTSPTDVLTTPLLGALDTTKHVWFTYVLNYSTYLLLHRLAHVWWVGRWRYLHYFLGTVWYIRVIFWGNKRPSMFLGGFLLQRWEYLQTFLWAQSASPTLSREPFEKQTKMLL
jgi:hypothetical protein